jgi:Ca2+-binding EF-hand superfamily protein
MKKSAPFIISVASAMVFSAGPAAGAEEYAQTFEQIDADGDGYISVEEARVREGLSENLLVIDENADGKLNSAEFSAFEGKGRLTPPEESEISEPGAAPY